MDCGEGLPEVWQHNTQEELDRQLDDIRRFHKTADGRVEVWFGIRTIFYEVSAGYRFSRYLTADLTLFYSKGDNLIQTVDQHNENTGRFINKGVEVSASSMPLDNLRLYASYSYLHTSLTDLVGAPKNQYYLGVELMLWNRLNIAADLKGVGGLYVAPEIHNQNYALLNLKLTFKVCRYLDVFTRLENITDARYTINRGYPMPGFTALGGFKLSI